MLIPNVKILLAINFTLLLTLLYKLPKVNIHDIRQNMSIIIGNRLWILKRIVHFIFIHIPYSDSHKQILRQKI